LIANDPPAARITINLDEIIAIDMESTYVSNVFVIF